MQYAFISFVMGENLESFEQWKRLFSLLCGCATGLYNEDTLSKELFMRFIPVVYEQLKQLPKDFFSDELSKVSFINHSLNSFFESVEDEKVSKTLKARAAKLKAMLKVDYDYAP